jgi:hypothetical protein
VPDKVFPALVLQQSVGGAECGYVPRFLKFPNVNAARLREVIEGHLADEDHASAGSAYSRR